MAAKKADQSGVKDEIEEEDFSPAGSGPAQELAGLRVPQELLETFPFSQLWGPGVELIGLFVRHQETHSALFRWSLKRDVPGVGL
jgi:hypothetical protein